MGERVLRRVAGKRDALCGDTKPLEGLAPPLLQPRLVGGVGFTGEPGRSSSGPVSANTCLSRRRTPRCAMRICLISVSVRAQIHGGFLRHLPRPKSTDASPDRGGSGPPRFSRDPRWHKRLETRQSRSACFGLSCSRSGPRRSGNVAMPRRPRCPLAVDRGPPISCLRAAARIRGRFQNFGCVRLPRPGGVQHAHQRCPMTGSVHLRAVGERRPV